MSGDEVDEVMREYRRYCGGLERQVHECGAEAEEVNGPERLSEEMYPRSCRRYGRRAL